MRWCRFSTSWGVTALLGKDAPNLSRAVITRLTAEWQADYDAWQKRDLSVRRFVYVWADNGVYVQTHMDASANDGRGPRVAAALRCVRPARRRSKAMKMPRGALLGHLLAKVKSSPRINRFRILHGRQRILSNFSSHPDRRAKQASD